MRLLRECAHLRDMQVTEALIGPVTQPDYEPEQAKIWSQIPLKAETT